MGYMGRSGKRMNTYLNLSTKMPNKKQKERITITALNNQYFRNFLNNFKI